MSSSHGNLLCIANFRTNAGYAWEFIESLYAAVADDLAPFGIRTWVAYPEIVDPPKSLEGSAATPLELRLRLNHPDDVVRLMRVIRERDIRTIYFSDRPPWHVAYAALRRAGIRTIIVHDHTSGERTAATGVRGAAKQATRRFRPAMADVVLAVSDYVRRRKVEIDLIPAGRVRVMFNSVVIPESIDRHSLRELAQAPPDRPLVVCAARAAEYKGVQHLLRAFDLVAAEHEPAPMLIYFGDGPYMEELQQIRSGLAARANVIFAGYDPHAAELSGGADLCVVPSVWGEAFGLAALEPGARGVPVVASRVGGIPEVVVDGETGILVPPGAPQELAAAMITLLRDAKLRRAMGERAADRARERFSRARQLAELTALFRSRLGLPA